MEGDVNAWGGQWTREWMSRGWMSGYLKFWQCFGEFCLCMRCFIVECAPVTVCFTKQWIANRGIATRYWRRHRPTGCKHTVTVLSSQAAELVTSFPSVRHSVQVGHCQMWMYIAHSSRSKPLKPCPHCRRKVRQSPNSATVALFCDSVDRL